CLSPRTHQPAGGRRCDTGCGLVRLQRRCHFLDDLRPCRIVEFGSGPRQRPDRERESRRIRRRLRHVHDGIELVDRDVLESGALQNALQTCRVGEGEGAGRIGNGRAAMSGAKAHTFSVGARQQTNTRRPPGFKALRMLPKAAAGSAKNITPKREATTSNCGVNGWTEASASTKAVFLPPRAARARASASMGAEMSSPTARPPGPTYSS